MRTFRAIEPYSLDARDITSRVSSPPTVASWNGHAKYVIYLKLLALFCISPMFCDLANGQEVDSPSFANIILPLLNDHCIDCHGVNDPEAKLDLSRFQKANDLTAFPDLWQEVAVRVTEHEMPPADSNTMTEAERQQFGSWLHRWRTDMASRNAGDPGIVLTRRLNTAEYNNTLRDLLGVDIHPAKEFPVDPANEAGFDNSGQSLAMSPGLLNKYLAAARTVAKHAVLTPTGLEFAPHPVMTETDRDKYAVNRIVHFYQSQPTDLAAYFLAAWHLHQLPAASAAQTSVENFAVAQGLSSKYFSRLHTLLSAASNLDCQAADAAPVVPETEQEDGHKAALVPEIAIESDTATPIIPVGEGESDIAADTLADGTTTQKADDTQPILSWLQCRWQSILASELDAESAKTACEELAQAILKIRRTLQPTIENLNVDGIHKGSQPFVLWKNRQYAQQRQIYDAKHVERIKWDKLPQEIVELIKPPTSEERRAEYDRQMAIFCEVFPDDFYISERGRDYLDTPREKQEKGRLLSAGFHSMMGYFRDDTPLMNLILSDSEKEQLDALWQELDFLTWAPTRQYQGFLWFERTDSRYMRDEEFDFARAEDKDATSPAMIRKLAEVYIAKADRNGAEGDARTALVEYFHQIEEQIGWVESAHHSARPKHLAALIEFGRNAYRGNWTSSDESDLLAFYDQLIQEEGLNHEEAIQDAIVMILMSPKFLYRVDLNATEAATVPLNGIELASRLSYFLWSSMPDGPLLDHARNGTLDSVDTLTAEVDRMLADSRVRELAVEFGGQWLGFRRFEEHNSVDRQRFPEFSDALRQSMFEEPIQFLTDMVQHNRSVLECLQSNRMFVDGELARHYKIPELTGEPSVSALGLEPQDGMSPWRLVENSQDYGRSGLPTMAVFLTQNSPGLRTSPVKRGYWVVRQLLGERIPPPPPGVPELPQDESQLGELSLRQVLERHREQASCAVCHDRFDSLGLVFENFGPVGELRQQDLAGHPVDTRAVFPNGQEGTGTTDLQSYLMDERREDFIDNLCKKLLAFALGRTLQISDDSLVASMRSNLARDDYRFDSLIKTIVTSPQFLHKRGDRSGAPLANNVPITLSR